MTIDPSENGFSDSATQLLRVCLRPAAEAKELWRHWSAQADYRRLDASERILLPGVFRRAAALGLAMPERARLQGVYRHAWTKNHRLLSHGQAAITALKAEFDEVLLSGHVAAMLSFGHDRGATPLGCFEVIVSRQRAPRAVETLLREGWRSDVVLTTELLEVRRGLSFVKSVAGGAVVRLRLDWRVFGQTRTHLDLRMWAPQKIELLGTSCHAIAPELAFIQIALGSHAAGLQERSRVLACCGQLLSCDFDAQNRARLKQATHQFRCGARLRLICSRLAELSGDASLGLTWNPGDIGCWERAESWIEKVLPPHTLRGAVPGLLWQYVGWRTSVYQGSGPAVLIFLRGHFACSDRRGLARTVARRLRQRLRRRLLGVRSKF